MEKAITMEMLDSMQKAFDADRANRVAMNSVTKNGIAASAIRPENANEMRHTFNVFIKQGEITNQKASGRCWMFAALNTLRFQLMKNLNLKTFELSQSYLFFYDKLEKSNYFLESILNTLGEPTNGRLISYLLMMPLNDGGQWDMFTSLVQKYGVVPKDVMPETFSSSNSREMVGYLTEKLREFACILRTAHANGATMEELRAKKDGMVQTIFNMLCVCLGQPPKTFTFEVRTEDEKFIRDESITPQDFFKKYVKMDLNEYISLINAPTADKPYGKTYTVAYLGNVHEGNPVKYLNLPIDALKKAAIAQMQDGEPVWFGCDVGKHSSRDGGVMDTKVYDLEALFNTEFTMNKAQRLDYGQSLMTHAMVFQGVNLGEDGKPNRWRVENSWGKDAGVNGYYIMSDAWFDEYMYQIVVNKKYLTEEQRAAFAQQPITLEPWDPMGSLACAE